MGDNCDKPSVAHLNMNVYSKIRISGTVWVHSNTNSPKSTAFAGLVYTWFAVLTNYSIVIYCEMKRIRDSVVSIATGYGLGDRVRVRVPVGLRIFSSTCRPDLLWGPPNLLSNEYRCSFLGGKAAGAWSWPFASNYCRGQENVDLYMYIHSPIRLHGAVLN
jgi:hypothetical protein